jgi:hypothetical protein
MPLTRAQAENFITEFFRDHRLIAPPLRYRRVFKLTLAKRKRLNLPYTITRQALADQVAARLCREVIRRDRMAAHHLEAAKHRADHKRARIPKFVRVTWKDFDEWRKYVRGVVVHTFGKGDGLC